MLFEDFENLIAAHGTRPEQWPDPALAHDPDIARWLRTEHEMVSALTPTPLSTGFTDRVMQAVAQTETNVLSFPVRPRITQLVRPRASLPIAAALIAGAFVFLNLPNPEEQQWQAVAEASGWGDLYAWVEG